jgi:DNA (cytosine-5)-methyltransferase 1
VSDSNSLTVLDLFSGAGGLALGFKSAGFKTIAGVDNDSASLETFARNFPDSRTICEDLSSVSVELARFFKSLRGKVDVIVGGPPCQGFSIAGKRIIDDPRNSLYRHYIETVEVIRPKYVVIENVPTIRTMGDGKIANAIIQDLENLGYEVRVMTVNASDYGVPQNRKRAFFIAKRGSTPVVFPDPLTTDNKLTTKDAIGDLPRVEDYFENLPIPYTHKAKNDYQRKMRKGSKQLFNHWSVAHTEQTKSIIALVPDGGNYKDLPRSLQNTRRVNIAWTRMASNLPSFTIDAGHNHHFHYKANRVPTVRECARIQSFPDTFVFLGNKTSQFRQVGNAVPPLLAEVLAKRIFKDLQ